MHAGPLMDGAAFVIHGLAFMHDRALMSGAVFVDSRALMTCVPLQVLGFVQETGDAYMAFKWAKVRLDDGTTGYVSGQFVQGVDTP